MRSLDKTELLLDLIRRRLESRKRYLQKRIALNTDGLQKHGLTSRYEELQRTLRSINIVSHALGQKPRTRRQNGKS